MTGAVNFQRIFFLCASALCMIAFSYGLMSSGLFMSLLFSWLAALSSALAWAAWTLLTGKCDAASAISALLCVALGPFGALMVFLMQGVLLIVGDRRDDALWLMDIVKDTEGTPAVLLYRRLLSLRSQKGDSCFYSRDPVAPFLDTAWFGTLEEKRRALNQIGRYYSPRFLPALKVSLQDGANLVRVHAASTLTLVEERQTEREIRCQKQFESRPRRVRLQRELARAKAERAQSGLLDEPSRDQTRDEAIELFMNLGDRQLLLPQDRLSLVSLLMDAGRYRDARPILRELIRRPGRHSLFLDKMIEQWLLGAKKYAALVRYVGWDAYRDKIDIRTHARRRRELHLSVV